MRILLGALIALFAAPFVIIAGYIAHAYVVDLAFERKTPLVANIGGPWDVVRETFRERIRLQFPVGTPANRIVATLAAQGFAPTDSCRASMTSSDADTARLCKLSNVPKMAIERQAFACTTTWIVAWELDSNQRVTRTYAESGGICL